MSNAANAISFERKIETSDVLVPIVEAGFLSQLEAETLKQKWVSSKEHPMALLQGVSLNDPNTPGRKLSFDEIGPTLAKYWGISYIRIDSLNLDLDKISQLIPHPYAERLGIVPIEITAQKVVIATSEPFINSWIDQIAAQTKRKVELRLALPSQINHLLSEIYIVQKAFKNVAREQGRNGSEKLKLLRQGKISELDQLVEKSRVRNPSGQESSVARIVDWLINYALVERASDIHIEPKKGLGLVRFRVDGDLRTVYRLDHETLMMIVSRFKILGDMKLDEKRKPLDGGLKRTLDNGKQVEMRLSTLPISFGEKLVIRIFDKQVQGKDLSFIGFHPEDLATWQKMISEPQGLILVTGPTGSGKTTTLYTTLNIVATPDVNVCTAEDPIEMEVDTFNQVQVNSQIGLNFAECIRAFLRQDPDVIMVGEIRDLETGEMAIQSSLTGHLVFSTLHTNGALATILRLIDLGLPSFLINSSLSGILAQRLVRKLCPHCKVEVPTDESKWVTLLDGEKLPMPKTVFEARGCEDCKHTGYLGRLCVYELVSFNDKIKRVIHQKIEISELKEKTKGLFTPLRINGARKIILGETTLDEVLKVAY
jgi:general secretion pathway protein E